MRIREDSLKNRQLGGSLKGFSCEGLCACVSIHAHVCTCMHMHVCV